MCHQVTYTLTCEHVKTQTIYCADATDTSSGTGNSSSSRNGQSSSSKHRSKSGVGSHSSKPKSSSHHSKASSSAGSSSKAQKRACANLTIQALPYPTPPSYASNPASFFSSPLSPRCPLAADCPFEAKNRCWNCCWCGKAWNETGRCSCVMLIDGNQVQCEHICCSQCEPAVGSGGWESAAGYA
ncbi:hypothetical protein CONLIGDRAFT_631498 [Coniochaeta ligniaria NRRL 30616]|uniref:Uncharacterized protein n=1 Tax=Coniochaeta ligniaria NRRL 30616 TaxID=1408157 RepID=A0A1J7IPZ3_9PEZI|nr:hypothetical protein CONLIGDRAFT_631498 [Coniochaeta ligniaria NRRL 30616]